MGAVKQHDRSEASGSMSGVDRAFKTIFYQLGQASAVVDVGMGQDYTVYLPGIKEEHAVADDISRVAALEQSAVQQDLEAIVESKQVAGAGDLAGCPAEFDVHLV